MLRLLWNENMKIYSRPRTWILGAVLFAGVALIAILMKSHHSGASNTWAFLNTALNISTVLIAFIVAVVGDIVAGEFSSGTIKMLLTQTSTRTSILAAKYLASLLYAALFTLFLFAVTYGLGGMLFGFGGANTMLHYLNATHHTATMSLSAYVWMQYGFLFIQVMITVTIAFMVSAAFRSSALAITLSILAFVLGNVLVVELSRYYTWVKYILFANTDLTQFVVGGPVIHGLTLHFSITMLIVYMVGMLALSWVLFAKRDVAYT